MAEEKSAEAIRDRNRRIREEAADKRRSKRESERRRAQTAQALDATEIMDDALARSTHAIGLWLKRHFNKVQWLLVAGIVGGIGWQVYAHNRRASEGKVTDALMAGVEAEQARVGDEGGEPDPRTGIGDPRAKHESDEARLKAAAAAYRSVAEGDAMPVLGRMGLAGVLFDQGKYKDAIVEYRKVHGSELASRDKDLKARAAECIGLSEEALGEIDPARKSFRELESSDSAALSALGLYHQARLDKKKGELDKAKERLSLALKKLQDNKITSPYLEQVARDLLGSIDPSALPAQPMLTPEQLEALKQQAAGGEGKEGVSPEQIEKLLEALGKTGASEPSGAPAPAPAPSGSGQGAP